ncbi:ABC transporter permease [Methanobrevibacter sp.]|uniref:ABC transporter permease n=1 Tax=Methanobrevibacter sp. TaxID=66852 RepID=UPI0038654861
MSKNEIFLLNEIVKKNFASKYKDSVLGIFWSILKPLLIMAMFTIIFSTIFSNRIENYPVYFLSGRCIYDFFIAAVNSSMGVLKANKNILQRTAAPKYIFILGSIISEFLNFLITLVLLLGVMVVTNAHFYWLIMSLSVIPVMCLILMIIGVSLILSICSVYYSDVQHLWTVVSMMLMYSSALFFPMDIIPEPYRQYMVLNPLYWAVDQFRCFFYQGIIPSFLDLLNFLLISVIILVFGIIIFKKYEKRIAMKF